MRAPCLLPDKEMFLPCFLVRTGIVLCTPKISERCRVLRKVINRRLILSQLVTVGLVFQRDLSSW